MGRLDAVECLGSKKVYENRWMAVREDTVRRMDGSDGVYAVIDTCDIALVVPVDGDRLHLVEQQRYPVGERLWEFPSGSVDADVDTEARVTAERELREETGLVAATVTPLATLAMAPSMSGQRCTVFLAADLTSGEPQREPDEDDMQSAWFTRDGVERMILDGVITDAKSIAAYAHLLLHERTRP